MILERAPINDKNSINDSSIDTFYEDEHDEEEDLKVIVFLLFIKLIFFSKLNQIFMELNLLCCLF